MKQHLLDADQFEAWIHDNLRGADDVANLALVVERAMDYGSTVAVATVALQNVLLVEHQVLLTLDAADAWIERHLAMGTIRRPEGNGQ